MEHESYTIKIEGELLELIQESVALWKRIEVLEPHYTEWYDLQEKRHEILKEIGWQMETMFERMPF